MLFPIAGDPVYSGAGLISDISGDGIASLAPGLRIVTDTRGDFGVIELCAKSILSDGWYDAVLRIELRLVF